MVEEKVEERRIGWGKEEGREERQKRKNMKGEGEKEEIKGVE